MTEGNTTVKVTALKEEDLQAIKENLTIIYENQKLLIESFNESLQAVADQLNSFSEQVKVMTAVFQSVIEEGDEEEPEEEKAN